MLTRNALPKQKEPENYEQVLESLRLSITSRQSRLAEIRQRERRASLWVTLYLLLAWVVYSAFWYMGWIASLFGRGHHYGQEDGYVKKALMMTPAVVGPVVSVVLLLLERGRVADLDSL
jgi:endoplasmic reticulum junction formation protein lunapark